ncbi:MAG TPA: 1-deoxy-D-xylulose-5-phosphate reductoisomerase, partial [Gammaproteobacteria bacterium]|nr:1-deoxy-D-xylulose-5-phosphate reductoisomerase [Gammaproteobacteria bacterium]
MNNLRRICILGSTGSIGQSTLAVVDANPTFEVVALSGHRNIDLLLQQCLKYRPKMAIVSRSEDAKGLADSLKSAGSKVEVMWGADALSTAASDDSVDMVMAAIVGAAGLESTLAAARAGKTLLLANKESLVMSGDLLFREIQASGATLIPIDSEHNAIFQCLPQNLSGQGGDGTKYVSKIALTA